MAGLVWCGLTAALTRDLHSQTITAACQPFSRFREVKAASSSDFLPNATVLMCC